MIILFYAISNAIVLKLDKRDMVVVASIKDKNAGIYSYDSLDLVIANVL